MKTYHKNTRGFTLLEILLVVAIIAILAGIVIVAINPAKQLGNARDAQRKSDIGEIRKAILQYYLDHGHYPTYTPAMSLTLAEICNTGGTSASSSIASCTANGLINLTELVPTYLQAIPTDPLGGTVALGGIIPVANAAVVGTAYEVALNSTANVYIQAVNAEYSTTKAGAATGVIGDLVSP